MPTARPTLKQGEGAEEEREARRGQPERDETCAGKGRAHDSLHLSDLHGAAVPARADCEPHHAHEEDGVGDAEDDPAGKGDRIVGGGQEDKRPRGRNDPGELHHPHGPEHIAQIAARKLGQAKRKRGDSGQHPELGAGEVKVLADDAGGDRGRDPLRVGKQKQSEQRDNGDAAARHCTGQGRGGQ